MTVFDNIRFPLRVRRMDGPDAEARVKRAAQMVELD